MHCESLSELLTAVLFTMSPQLEGLGPKTQYLVILFFFGQGEALPYFHLISLTIRSGLEFMRDQTGQINKLTGKYIKEMSDLKHIQ